MNTAVCILAAGAGRRLGAVKASVRVGERTLLEAALAAYGEAGVAPRFVVVSPAEAVTLEPTCAAGRATLLVNPQPERGMLSSLHVALQAVRAQPAPGVDALFVTPVDCPFVRPETIAAIARAAERSGAPVVVPRHAGRGGHPALFRAAVFDELLASPLDLGARAVVRAHAGDRLDFEVDDASVLDDIDTEAALAAARAAAAAAPHSGRRVGPSGETPLDPRPRRAR